MSRKLFPFVKMKAKHECVSIHRKKGNSIPFSSDFFLRESTLKGKNVFFCEVCSSLKTYTAGLQLHYWPVSKNE